MSRFGLERFPDELLLDIADYFHIRDLYQSFYGLNARFNAIVRSRNNLALVLSSPDDMDDPCFDWYAQSTVKLMIDHSSDVDLQPFSSLLSLVLNCPSEDQLKHFYACSFPHLLHLEFGIMTGKLSHRSLHDFFHYDRCPSLQSCIFHHDNNTVSSNRYRQLWSSSSPTIWCNAIDSSSRPTNPEVRYSLNVMHRHLQRLDLCCVSIADMDCFLRQTPNLERLKIASNEVYFSLEFFERLAAVLRQRLPSLVRFDCELLCLMPLDETSGIRQLHRCFDRLQFQSKYAGQCIRVSTSCVQLNN